MSAASYSNELLVENSNKITWDFDWSIVMNLFLMLETYGYSVNRTYNAEAYVFHEESAGFQYGHFIAKHCYFLFHQLKTYVKKKCKMLKTTEFYP